MKIIKEDLTDSKITLQQRISYDLPEDNDRQVFDDAKQELFEAFEEDLENIIKDYVKNKYDIFDKDVADIIKNIELIELDPINKYIKISVQLSKQLNDSQVKENFSNLVKDLVDEMESQKVTVNVTNVTSMYWDYSADEPRERSEEDYEDEEYVDLKVVGEVQITNDQFIKDESLNEEMNDKTRDFFDEFEYESKYDSFFGRGIAKYIYDTYTGKDIKLLDKYIDENEFSEDLKYWDKDYVDKIIREARIYASKTEGIKEGIETILNKLKDKITFKYQGNRKNKDGNFYDRFFCRIKKAGIFDLVGFEDELKKFGNKFGIIFKVTYPNDNQDHSVFWVEGRFKNQIIDKNGNKTTYESKQLKESVIDDYAKLKTQLNKEKQFNKKIEINDKLNKLIKDNNLEFKDQSSGNDNYKYQLVLSNGKEIGTIQLGSSGKVSVYESKQLKEDYSDDQKEFYKNMFDECCEESTIGHKRITIDVVDTESNCIESLLRYVQRVASQGHSFPIYVDNEGDWSYARFGFDGDGSDRIINIEVEEIKDEEGEE